MKNAGIVSAVLIGVFGLLALVMVLNGFMLSYMWQWFVVPLGVRSIGIPQAIGIAIIISMLTSEAEMKSDPDDQALNKMLGKLVAKLVVFGTAYGLSLLMPA